jgi:hypothetical protein
LRSIRSHRDRFAHALAARCAVRGATLLLGAALIATGLGAPPVGAMAVGHPPSTPAFPKAGALGNYDVDGTAVFDVGPGVDVTINGPRGGVPESNRATAISTSPSVGPSPGPVWCGSHDVIGKNHYDWTGVQCAPKTVQQATMTITITR